MVENVFTREIIDPFRQEKQINPIEIKIYSQLLNNKKENNDNGEIAKDIFEQLIDTKDNDKNNLRN